jgi:phage baseplate assembly protein V
MSLNVILNQIKQQTEQQILRIGQPMFATVVDYNNTNHSAQVELQPSGVLKWCRICAQGVGNGYGVMIPVIPGQQVLVNFVGGDSNQPIIVGSVYYAGTIPTPNSALSGSPVPLSTGQVALVDSAGTVLRLNGDGTVYLQAATVNMQVTNLNVSGNITSTTGNITATQGNIIDYKTSMEAVRQAYDTHKHTGVQTGGGSTGTTDTPIAD